MEETRRSFANAKRIVIKVGTSSITYDTGMINFTAIEKLVRVISDLENQGKEVVLVTSGAISVGADKIKNGGVPMTIPERQATAAVGQVELMYMYSKFFSEYNHVVAQILLTRDVVENATRCRNVINTFETLIAKGIVPIVNENDTVSVEELKIGGNDNLSTIKFGDNDTLSAIVAKIIKADLLIILSDIEGFYDSDPRTNDSAKIISCIRAITPEIEDCAGGKGTKRATGGMKTKLSAAKIVTKANINMVIASGANPKTILDIINGKNIGTLFMAKKEGS